MISHAKTQRKHLRIKDEPCLPLKRKSPSTFHDNNQNSFYDKMYLLCHCVSIKREQYILLISVFCLNDDNSSFVLFFKKHVEFQFRKDLNSCGLLVEMKYINSTATLHLHLAFLLLGTHHVHIHDYGR